MRTLLELIWKLIHPRDKCQVCLGSRGGVYGNENIVDGIIMCDNCTVSAISTKPLDH